MFKSSTPKKVKVKGWVVWMGERMDFVVNAGTVLRIAKCPRPIQNLPSPLAQARHCPHCCYCSSPPRPPAEHRCCCCSPSAVPWQTAPAPWRDQAPRKMPCVTGLWFEILAQYYFLGGKIQISLSAVLSMTLRHTFEGYCPDKQLKPSRNKLVTN